MAIHNWLVTGDTHGNYSRFKELEDKYKNDQTAIICLGDMALNYTLDERDRMAKKALLRRNPQTFYLVRGNHEARPQNVPTMKSMFDTEIGGLVYYEEEFPRIRYFMDYGAYMIGEYTVGVIGGAYSVDKYYRLAMGRQWFEDEQLSAEERDEAKRLFIPGGCVDFMLTHTCPISWQPTDLFLNGIDQSTVDNTMENFLESIKESFRVRIAWLFGHFHADRIELPHVEQYFKDTENLDTITERWMRYEDHGEMDWWLTKGPKFYMR